MRQVLDYRRRADDCRARANRLERQAAREALLALARSWERMADQREEALRGPLEPARG